jgi:hypothetical protein
MTRTREENAADLANEEKESGENIYRELGTLSKDAMIAIANDLIFAVGLSKKDALKAFKYVLSIIDSTTDGDEQ